MNRMDDEWSPMTTRPFFYSRPQQRTGFFNGLHFKMFGVSFIPILDPMSY